jgi:hypothetical protein
MEYLKPHISFRNIVSDSEIHYESDLVKDWFGILPGTTIYTKNSDEITIINTGKHNRHERPDIENALLIINGKVAKGPVECHINACDWLKHGHQNNIAYQKVILHVVRRINNGSITPSIPTIILKLDIQYFFECSINNSNQSSDLNKTIQYYGHNRWLDKINRYSGYHNDQKQLIKLLINNSFRFLGAGGNEEQFSILAKNIDHDKSQYLPSTEYEKYLWETSSRLKINWVKRGIRPAQQPQNRMKLAAELLYLFNNFDLTKVPSYSYISTLLSDECPNLKGTGIKTELLGNILLPFYSARALYFNMIEEYQKFYKMWNGLKLPYSYQKFKNRFQNILLENQLRSFSTLQGLIAIDNDWCSNKLCH